jgi:hypothetical protein
MKAIGGSKHLVFGSIVVLASILIPVAFCEVYARIVYVKPWYDRLVEEQSSTIGQLTLDGNTRRPDFFVSSGRRYLIRTMTIPKAKPESTRRVLFLGDSFTYGLGLKNEKEAFPSLIRQRFESLPPIPAVKTLDVFNGGLPSSLTKDWVELSLQLLDRFRPDLVLIVFFLRDGTRTNSIPNFFGKIRDEIVKRNAASPAYQHSYLFRYFRDNLDRHRVANDYTLKFTSSYFGSTSETEEWNLAQENILRIRDMARERSISVGFVIFPILVELNESYPFKRICDLLADFAKQNEMPVHSLLPAFLGKSGPDLWISPLDQHPNVAAHKIAAESLYDFTIGLLRKDEDFR